MPSKQWVCPISSPLKKGATGGLSASANRATGKTLLDKPAVAPDYRVFSGFSTGCWGTVKAPAIPIPGVGIPLEISPHTIVRPLSLVCGRPAISSPRGRDRLKRRILPNNFLDRRMSNDIIPDENRRFPRQVLPLLGGQRCKIHRASLDESACLRPLRGGVPGPVGQFDSGFVSRFSQLGIPLRFQQRRRCEGGPIRVRLGRP